MLSVVVQPAASQDRDGAAAVLAQAAAPTTRVQQRWAAAAERGALARWVTAAGGWTSAIGPRAPATVGCAVQPRRWVGGPHLRVAGPLPAVAPGLCSISGHQRDRDGVGHVCAVTPPVVPTFISVVHPLRMHWTVSLPPDWACINWVWHPCCSLRSYPVHPLRHWPLYPAHRISARHAVTLYSVISVPSVAKKSRHCPSCGVG